MSTSSSAAATCTRIPSRRGRRDGSGCKSGSRRSKPNSARYLYDDDNDKNNVTVTAKPCMHNNNNTDDNLSTLSLEPPDESIVGARDSCSSLGGFALAPCEDEKSELTCKVHNLTSVKYGRKFPKHHSGYHNRQHYEFQQYCKQAWQEGKRVRFQDNNNNNQDDASPATPLGALTKDSLISMMEANDSMRFGNNALHALNDYGEGSVGSGDDAEYPTNASISSETRSTAGSSAFDDEEEGMMEQSRHFTNPYNCGEEDDDDDTNDDRILDNNEPVSIGITTHRTKRGLLMKKYLPSASTMSRVFFFLGCVLTLWISVDNLTWARWQKQQNTKYNNNNNNNNNETPVAFHQTRLRRGLSASSTTTKTVVGKEVTHQDQWNDNSNQWDELQKYQQESWSELGYTQELWDNQDGDVSSENMDWNKLTEDQQDAAEDLGFTPSTWDHFNTNQITGDTSSREIDQQQKQPIANTATTATDTSAIQSPVLNETISTTPKTYPPTSTTTPPMTSSYREKDPVVFTTGGIPVTRHMILSFTSALCFTIVGIMEWIQHDFLFQLLLAISGVFGLLSSMFGNRNPGSSIAFHTLSVHCFLASSVAILWLRCRQQQPQQPSSSTPAAAAQFRSAQTQEEVLLLADLCFAVGSAMMVVSSYLIISFGADEAALLVDLQRFDVFAAILWVGCALIYACCAYKAHAQEVS